MKISHRGRYLRSTVLASALAGLTAPALAQTQTQTPPPEAQTGPRESIVVTGSRLARDPANAPTPLIQIDQDELLLTGEPNIVDTLANLPALQNSQVPEDTTGASLGNGGLSLLNLRNLGTQRTLTLIDGRRHVGSQPGSTAVDVDTIPRLLIRNVEVITGGSSAVYGSDAVAGVVNFILRDDFEGFEVDANVSQIVKGGDAMSYRISTLAGQNLFNDRLNVWASAEYDRNDNVRDDMIGWQRDGIRFLGRGIAGDGFINNEIFYGVTSLSRPLGGALTVGSIVQPSPADRPLIPFSNCTVAATQSTGNTPQNCFVEEPGQTWQFNPDGSAYLSDFGTNRSIVGIRRNSVVGGSGSPLTVFGDDRVPEQEAYRFAAGVNFELTPNIEFFADAKYVDELNIDSFQPAFFDIIMRDTGGARLSNIYALNVFELGLDNAFLDPQVRNAILNNTVDVYDAQGNVVAANQPFQQASFRLFSSELGGRPQRNERQLQRYVAGFRGGIPDIGFFRNINWEVGYTYGKVEDENVEFGTVDVVRYQWSADSVIDTFGEAGAAGDIVCRAQLLAARNGEVFLPAIGRTYAANDPNVTGCVPARIFGEEGYSQAALDYVLTDQMLERTNEQHNFLAFATTELWDFWGAGSIGLSLGYEYREEIASGVFTPPDASGSSLYFANALAALERSSYDVQEFFGEVRVPIVQNLPFVQNLEFTAAGRYSDYSTIGDITAYNLQGLWEVNNQLTFRGTYGSAVRAPQLGELFNPLSQTFLAITDPCDAVVIANTVDPEIQANRRANCAADGVPASYLDPNPSSTNPGRSGGNPFLQEETSTSWTVSTILRPEVIPNLTFVVDYYDFEIADAIATVGANQIVGACYNGAQLNTNFCNLLTRDPNTFEIIDFIQGPVNYAGLTTRGVDFQASYFHDFSLFGRDLGMLNYQLRGNWLINRSNFLNIDDPTDETALDSTIENPHFRARLTVQWEPNEVFSTSISADYIGSQEFVDSNTSNPEIYDRSLWNTEPFVRTDLNASYMLRDNIRLRGGVINLLDKEPPIQGRGVLGVYDIFDLYGRRFFVGLNASF
ncbi:TonB-dependent receptor [Glycocaulis profundi]|nr:TonB-dependent receptor [Glycocaulis profundi]